MARESARTAGRRTTPASSVPESRAATASPQQQKRSTRVIRGASQELVQTETVHVPQISSTAPVARAAEKAGGRKGRGRPRKEPLQGSQFAYRLELTANLPLELSTLPEEGNNVSNDTVKVQTQLPRQSTGANSGISGSTARLSYTAQEVAALDPEKMIDELPSLAEAADKVLNLLAPRNVSSTARQAIQSELNNSGSRTYKNFTKYTSDFHKLQTFYGPQNYISRAIATRAIMDEQSSGIDNTLLPDDIFHKANLAMLACQIISVSALPLEEIHADFPGQFVSRLATPSNKKNTIGSSALTQETFELALDIRTQYYISILETSHGEADFDPEALLQSVFFVEDNLREWGTDGLKGKSLNKKQRSEIQQRFGEIRDIVTNETENKTEQLRAAFSYEEFMSSLLSWVRLRSDEIDGRLDALGGAEAIQTALDQHLPTVKPTQPLVGPRVVDSAQTNFLDANIDPRLSGMGGTPQAVVINPATQSDRYRAWMKQKQADLQRQAQLTNAQMTLSNRSMVDGNNVLDAQTQQGLLDDTALMRTLQQHANSGNPSNVQAPTAPMFPAQLQARPSLLDRQANAERVTFESQRTAVDDYAMPDPTQDTGFQFENQFQAQTPQQSAGRKRKRQSTTTNTAKRVHASNALESAPGTSQEVNDNPALTQGEKYRSTVNPVARTIRANTHERPAQIRRAWTEKETDHLIALIEEHGTSWAYLKKIDAESGKNFLVGRDQVALKDKARNMKFDYLK
jgi:hypothetical protein